MTNSAGGDTPEECPPSVLVVEDDEQVRTLLLYYLTEVGIPALSASNAAEALDLQRRHARPLGLVLLDGTLSGAELLQKLRAFDPAVRVCFTSGDGSPEQQERMRGLGAKFLPKPFGPAELAAVLARTGFGSHPGLARFGLQPDRQGGWCDAGAG